MKNEKNLDIRLQQITTLLMGIMSIQSAEAKHQDAADGLFDIVMENLEALEKEIT